MNISNELSYREWQSRNTCFFNSFGSAKKKEIRLKGYKNVGWQNVKKSWEILQNISQVINLGDERLRRGDVNGYLNHSIIETQNAIKYAEDSIDYAKKSRQQIEETFDKANKIAEEMFSKHKIL
jgi:hypothetical protein